MEDIAIKVDNISIMFNKSSERVDSIKEYLIKLVKNQLLFEEFWALKDISFDIKKGESLGIIGLNGAGKSTLLKVIASVLKPSKGSVEINGSVAPLIELGAGFDSNLSARENIFLNGAVLGYDRKQMRKKFEQIVDFAELWEFIDIPIKNFSSGMVARLGFSIAVAHTPDILIVDEILGVGDYKFQKKCEKRMNEIIDNGATVIFVSHSIEQVKKVCSRAIWLERGRLVMDGDIEEVCNKYMEN